MTHETFFMVVDTDYVPSKYGSGRICGPPSIIYECEADAEAEAVRLAKGTSGEFAILKATATVSVVNGVPKWSEEEQSLPTPLQEAKR